MADSERRRWRQHQVPHGGDFVYLVPMREDHRRYEDQYLRHQLNKRCVGPPNMASPNRMRKPRKPFPSIRTAAAVRVGRSAVGGAGCGAARRSSLLAPWHMAPAVLRRPLLATTTAALNRAADVGNAEHAAGRTATRTLPGRRASPARRRGAGAVAAAAVSLSPPPPPPRATTRTVRLPPALSCPCPCSVACEYRTGSSFFSATRA
jgi:hypothetical protein